MTDVEDGKCDAVLCMDVDRLGRGDQFDAGLIYRAFTYSETLIITPSETLNPKDESFELYFGIKSLFAREELRTISKRLIRGRIQSAKQGKCIAAKPPYGYGRDENLKLYPGKNAWVVKKIFEMTLDGKGRRVIADELNELGIPSPSGRTWGITSIRNIIQNEVYYGAIVFQKNRNKKQHGKYVVTLNKVEDRVVTEDAHPPIISKETWELANKIVKERYIPSKNQNKKLSNPLAGIIKCEVCGYSMWKNRTGYVSKAGKKDKTKQASYVMCHRSECKRLKLNKMVTFNRLESALLEGLKELLNQMQLSSGITQPKQVSRDMYDNLLNEKAKELNDITRQRDTLHDLLEQGVYTIDIFLDRQKKLAEKEKMLREDIFIIETKLDALIEKEKTTINFIPELKNVIHAYESTNDIEKKNALLKSVLEKATLYRSPDSKEPDDFRLTLYPRF